jgi:hypothetical protein
MLERTVALATVVKSSEAFTDQLAMNQKKQNVNASFAVSWVVKGAESSSGSVVSGMTNMVCWAKMQ